ncbi:hypothetical protein [Bradyrhizobium ivorense]|uniref:hypothetical protein n=1 Tax=Bradyrhizobium ivorense TaxID=2511166 RepID=UPI0010B6A07F|nr:hypothetical protein [Bradyrhizobium ivorense]VIO77367.1 hypothetical protein CI41S_56220 [Bradyrhizobium ivorense]
MAQERKQQSLVVMLLVAFCSGAKAQARCPELTKLRSDAAEAAKQMTGVPTSDRCEAYTRFSLAWGDIVRYAADHRDPCDISSTTLTELEKRYREAKEMRDNVCAGRPLRPFPPEKNQR